MFHKWTIVAAFWMCGCASWECAPHANEPRGNAPFVRFGSHGLRHAGGVTALSFSPDTKFLASGGADGIIRISDTASGQPLHRKIVGTPMSPFSEGTRVTSLSFSPTGTQLAFGDSLGNVGVWRFAGGESWSVRLRKAQIVRVGYLSEEEILLIDVEGHCTVVDARDGTMRRQRRAMVGAQATFVQNKVCLLAGSHGQLIELDTTSLRATRVLDFSTDNTVCAVFCNEECAVIAFSDGSVLVHQRKTQDDRVLRLRTGLTTGALLHGMGGFIACADGALREFKYSSPEPVDVGVHGSGATLALAITSDSRVLASGTAGGSIRLWSLSTKSVIRNVSLQEGYLGQIAYDSATYRIATTSCDGTVRIWNATGECLEEIREHALGACPVAFSPDGKLLAVGTVRNEVLIRNLEGRTSVRYQLGAAAAAAVAWRSMDELVTIDEGCALGRLCISTGAYELVRNLPKDGWFIAVALSTDGRYSAAGGFKTNPTVVDCVSGDTVCEIEVEGVVSLALTSDYVAVGCADGRAVVSRVRGPRACRTFMTSSLVCAVAVSPDGSELTSGELHDRVTRWELCSGQRIASYEGDIFPATLAYSADSSELAIGSRSGACFLWKPWLPQGLDESGHCDSMLRNADVAYPQMARVAASGIRGVNYIAEHWREAPSDDIRRMVEDLDDPDVTVRSRACDALTALGVPVLPALKRHHRATHSQEIRDRLEETMKRLGILECSSMDNVVAFRFLIALSRSECAEAKNFLGRRGWEKPLSCDW